MRSSTEHSYRERILRVLIHIQQHLDEDLPLEDLAHVAHFSSFHFHRIFRGMVGEPVSEHIRRLRLERAAWQLKVGDRAIIQLALDARYETHESFTRAFRAMFGVSPTQFRAVHRVPPYPSVPSEVHYEPEGGVTGFVPIEAGGEPMDVRVEEVRPIRVAFVRHTGPYAACGAAWQKLCGWAGPRGLIGPSSTFLGVSHDDPEVTPPEKIRYDACVTVPDSVQGEGDIGVQEVGGGEYAITTHRGPYERLAQTYARLCGEWLPKSGREVRSAPSLEFYRNSPETTPPEDLITEVHVPLAPR